MSDMRKLLEEYRATAARLRVRRDRLAKERREGAFACKSDADRRLRLVGDMYLDVALSIREMEEYLA